VVSWSSTESEYRAMANMTCELVWIRNLFTVLGLTPECPIRLYCDNHAAIHIVENPVFHKCTKHIKVDCHVARQKIEKKIVKAQHVSSGHQLADLLTKSLGKLRFDFICDRLGM